MKTFPQCDDSLPRDLLLLPTTQEWGEDRGEGWPGSASLAMNRTSNVIPHIARPERRVRRPGLQEPVLGTCRPRALTRRAVGVSIGVEMSGLAACRGSNRPAQYSASACVCRLVMKGNGSQAADLIGQIESQSFRQPARLRRHGHEVWLPLVQGGTWRGEPPGCLITHSQ